MALLLFLFGALGTIVYALVLFSRQKYWMAIGFLLLPLVFFASVHFGRQIGWQVRRAAFVRLAERSGTLVAAIRSYESKYGAPPPALNNLVPEFLRDVPHTGMRAYPNYRYVGSAASKFDGNPWMLEILIPSGGINLDTFIYFPLQNYPMISGGGYVEPIRDWAYVHD